MEGHTVLSRQHVDKPIPYKYVIVDGDGCCEYEFIYKQKQKHGDHVNRCLVVRSELLALGGESGQGLGAELRTAGARPPRVAFLCRAGPLGGSSSPAWPRTPAAGSALRKPEFGSRKVDQCNRTTHFQGETRKRIFAKGGDGEAAGGEELGRGGGCRGLAGR